MRSWGSERSASRYWYDGDGLRVATRTFRGAAAPVDTRPTWDRAASLPVLLQDSIAQGAVNTTTTYLYGLDLIAITDSAAGTSYVLSDGLGSTTQLASTAGAVTDSYSYDVFGGPRATTGATANEFRFTGEQTDKDAARGLLYLRARHYDPALGRFLQQDPLPFMQRYAYVGNNPANKTDPRGLGPDEPEAVPLPAAGDASASARCLSGYIKCIEEIVPREKYRRRNDPDKFLRTDAPYNAVCADFLRMCRGRMLGGDPRASFDFDGAQQRMRDLTVAHGRGFGIRFPRTGTGGWLGESAGRQNKEGTPVCLPWGYRLGY